MIEDELLKLKFKLGSEDALWRIYEKYLDHLLSVAMAFLNDAPAAEDVVHDVFVSLAQCADRFRIAGSLKHYLATCVANRARDRLRAGKRHRDHPGPEPRPTRRKTGSFSPSRLGGSTRLWPSSRTSSGRRSCFASRPG